MKFSEYLLEDAMPDNPANTDLDMKKKVLDLKYRMQQLKLLKKKQTSTPEEAAAKAKQLVSLKNSLISLKQGIMKGSSTLKEDIQGLLDQIPDADSDKAKAIIDRATYNKERKA